MPMVNGSLTHILQQVRKLQPKQKVKQLLRKVPQKKQKATKTRLDPSCWKGYKKSGTKVKGGTRVNNCVKAKKKK